MSPTIINNIFASKATPYNLHNPVSFKIGKVYSVYNDTESLSHLAPKIWSLGQGILYHQVILNQIKKNELHLIVPADYAKIFTSSRIHLKRLPLTSLAAVSTIITDIYLDFIYLTLISLMLQFYASVNAVVCLLFHGYMYIV